MSCGRARFAYIRRGPAPRRIRIDTPMTRTLSTLGWLLVAIDLVTAATLVLRRDGGDAATRGLGQGFGTLLAALGVAAALLLLAGRAPERPFLVVVGTVLAAAPVALGVALTASRQGLALVYPSLRDRGVPREASPQYAYPGAAEREAALALVLNDYAKLDTLLRAAPAPDLMARDERGESLLGLATQAIGHRSHTRPTCGAGPPPWCCWREGFHAITEVHRAPCWHA